MSEHNILELDMNLEDFEDFEPLPPGNYPAEVRSAEMRISEKGNEYYYCTIIINPNDFPADYDVANAPDGLILVYARMQKPDANNRRSITQIKNWYRALGLKMKTNIIDPETWVGHKLMVNLGLSEFQGEVRNDIRSVEKLDG